MFTSATVFPALLVLPLFKFYLYNQLVWINGFLSEKCMTFGENLRYKQQSLYFWLVGMGIYTSFNMHPLFVVSGDPLHFEISFCFEKFYLTLSLKIHIIFSIFPLMLTYCASSLIIEWNIIYTCNFVYLKQKNEFSFFLTKKNVNRLSRLTLNWLAILLWCCSVVNWREKQKREQDEEKKEINVGNKNNGGTVKFYFILTPTNSFIYIFGCGSRKNWLFSPSPNPSRWFSKALLWSKGWSDVTEVKASVLLSLPHTHLNFLSSKKGETHCHFLFQIGISKTWWNEDIELSEFLKKNFIFFKSTMWKNNCNTLSNPWVYNANLFPQPTLVAFSFYPHIF